MHLYVILTSLLCYLYVTRMYSHVTHMSVACPGMSFVYPSYALVGHSYGSHMYSHVTRMSLVCHSYVTRMLLYVTRMRFYHEPITRDIDEDPTLNTKQNFLEVNIETSLSVLLPLHFLKL